MNTTYLTTLVCSLFVWITLFGVSNWIEYRIRGVFLGTSSTSSLGGALLNCLLIVVVSPVLLLDFSLMQPSTVAIHQFLVFQIGFFVAHSMVSILSTDPRKDELFHHTLAIVALSIPAVTGSMGGAILLVLFLSELSFCFYLTHFFKSIEQQAAANISWIAFKWVFTIVRLVVVPVCSYFIFVDPHTTFVIQALVILFNGLNVYWMERMWRKQQPANSAVKVEEDVVEAVVVGV
ncbi:MAG: TLC domain-containing protein [Bacteroidota bacterium]